MVIKEYKKGKELFKLEKIKEKIEEILNSKKYDYNFRFKVSYNIELEIKPSFKNENLLEISNDFKDITDYLYSNNISFNIYWWEKTKKITIEVD